ncbi:phenylalanine--tRNA ligase subunit beta, partial [Candidatus Kaiserbacteria bacterium]|nr:phenylalanine--tRNA ligase subunit beta [Candidatus Kaiserbacteria bacterium]
MKISRNWLQTYFEKQLPKASNIADLFTFHSFEIESVEGDVLDVKVLPNRAADCLSHRGIAKELSAILDLPLKRDPLREFIPEFPKTDMLDVVADDTYVVRHTGALVRGVTVGPSPSWLQERLASVGQRSINNVVDILNFVMLEIGQPAGAFDVGKMKLDNGILKIDIRRAKSGEKIMILTGEMCTLMEHMFAFTDAVGGGLLDIAGIKGGLSSGVTDTTTDLFVSVGNYDGTLIRRASQALKLFTDASQRFQNRPSPDLTVYGMREILRLLKEVAGGELVGVVDIYPKKQKRESVSITVGKISKHLGATYSDGDVADVFRRLDFSFTKKGSVFTVTPSFERTDIVIPEDLIEEVGRIIGYEKVSPTELPPLAGVPDQARFHGIERMKDMLIVQGFIEVSTQSFTKKGDVELANPLDKTRPALRQALKENLTEALGKAKLYAPLVLPPNVKPKLFEVGTVFPKEGEYLALEMTERVPEWADERERGGTEASAERAEAAAEGSTGTSDNLSVAKLEEYGKDYVPKRYVLGAYKPFSIYPFVLRDIALWVLSGTSADEVLSIVRSAAGSLLFRADLFDTFEKEGKTSHAFRLVFQSTERTLSDDEVNTHMQSVTTAADAKGWQV